MKLEEQVGVRLQTLFLRDYAPTLLLLARSVAASRRKPLRLVAKLVVQFRIARFEVSLLR